MATHREQLLVDGNALTAAEELMEEGKQADKPDTYRLGGPFEAVFPDHHRFLITAVNSEPPTRVAELYNPSGQLADSHNYPAGPLAAEFRLQDGSDTYTVSLQRAARGELEPDEIYAYRESQGTRCLYCGNNELHKGRCRDTHDRLERTVTCCHCGAEWAEQFSLTNVVQKQAPARNIALRTDAT